MVDGRVYRIYRRVHPGYELSVVEGWLLLQSQCRESSLHFLHLLILVF